MTALARTAVRWTEEAEGELIDDVVSGVSFDDLAAKYGRGRNAIEQKISWLRKRELLEPAEDARHHEREMRPNQDALHVIACLAQGGFPALSERPSGRLRLDPPRAPQPEWRKGTAAERAIKSDLKHSEDALEAGGFPACNEIQGAKGHRSVCLPLIYPTRL